MDPRLISLLFLAQIAIAELAPERFAYLLQSGHFAKNRADAVAKLAASDRDLLVIDYSFWGDHDSRWTAEEVDAIRAGKPGRKVLAYLSVGEAGTYRYYWKKFWKAGSPAFLQNPNPNWPDNIRVAYWDPAWHKHMRQYLGYILEQGFDGIWLDTVDTFEHFEHKPETDEWLDNRPNPATGKSYRDDMVALVQMLANSARVTRPDFLVVPNNGAQLLARPTYLGTIDAIGIEDLFGQGKGHRKYLLELLAPAYAAKKPVLLIEYKERGTLRESARELRSPLLITDRPLKTLGEAIWTE
jgi:cysteinyl-tRNA synthetase